MKAYVFPGQGSQFTGMGKSLYDGNARARELFERANEILGFNITDVMFSGTAEELKATRVTQPAIFVHSVLLASCLKDGDVINGYEGGFNPDMVAGHSLGEFSALTAAGAKRAVMLAVGGAFHSPLMEPARAELAQAIEKTDISSPVCPIYQNVNAQPSRDPAVIKANLLSQLTSPVRWTQTVKNMAADGADEFIELGPGTVLQGLVKKIIPGANAISIA